MIFTSVLRFVHAGQGEPFVLLPGKKFPVVVDRGYKDMLKKAIEVTKFNSSVWCDLRGCSEAAMTCVIGKMHINFRVIEDFELISDVKSCLWGHQHRKDISTLGFGAIAPLFVEYF